VFSEELCTIFHQRTKKNRYETEVGLTHGEPQRGFQTKAGK